MCPLYPFTSQVACKSNRKGTEVLQTLSVTNLFVSDSDIEVAFCFAQQVIRSDGITTYASTLSSYLLVPKHIRPWRCYLLLNASVVSNISLPAYIEKYNMVSHLS